MTCILSEYSKQTKSKKSIYAQIKQNTVNQHKGETQSNAKPAKHEQSMNRTKFANNNKSENNAIRFTQCYREMRSSELQIYVIDIEGADKQGTTVRIQRIYPLVPT
mmetsp:Transcript_34734/g.55786  ORF Transcript_34734/g.55786 Transcript_34734/m.55786 type:complete len:106 (+) Transcript_34734:330-647(+)